MPALLTMMSRPPNRSTAAATSASTSAPEVTAHRHSDVVAAELRNRGFGCLEIHVAEHDPRALADEALRDGETQSLCTTGDNCGLTGQQRHTITVLPSTPRTRDIIAHHISYMIAPGPRPTGLPTAGNPNRIAEEGALIYAHRCRRRRRFSADPRADPALRPHRRRPAGAGDSGH